MHNDSETNQLAAFYGPANKGVFSIPAVTSTNHFTNF